MNTLTEKTRLKQAKEKQSLTADDWMKVMLSGESPIHIGEGDDTVTFVLCPSSEIYEDDCLK